MMVIRGPTINDPLLSSEAEALAAQDSSCYIGLCGMARCINVLSSTSFGSIEQRIEQDKYDAATEAPAPMRHRPRSSQSGGVPRCWPSTREASSARCQTGFARCVSVCVRGCVCLCLLARMCVLQCSTQFPGMSSLRCVLCVVLRKGAQIKVW